MTTEHHYDVIIAGAGPVGLCTAIDLGRRGVRVLLLERGATTAPFPKMDRCNGRTMEMFRRIGLADRVRALGYPQDNPMDIPMMRTLADQPIDLLRHLSVGEVRKKIAATRDGSLTCEPYQLVSQNYVEPLLKEVAEATPGVDVRYGHEVTGFAQHSDHVTVSALAEATEQQFSASYLVGCDGGRSPIRKALGIELHGQGGLRTVTQVIFWSEELYEKILGGKGRHYCLPNGVAITAQGNRKQFTLHNPYPLGSDFESLLADAIGFPCDFTIQHIVSWKHHLLLADRYRDGRVLIAGDAAHLVIPTGGLGMNTGVGDAFDLAWKLAGTVQGWGGPALLDSYQAERRPVAARNIEASGWAARSVGHWAPLLNPDVYGDDPVSLMKRRRLVEAFREYHSRTFGPDGFGMVGVEYSYTYSWSAIVADEPDNVPEWDISVYRPHAKPGVRLPHMWLDEGRPIQDALGPDYTLLDLTGSADTRALQAAFAKLGAPLDITRIVQDDLLAVYGAPLLLLRPDLHVAWRGHVLPEGVDALAALVTGN